MKALGLAKALIAAMKFESMPAGRVAAEIRRGPKFRRGFLEFRLDPNVKGLRAFYVDERPGWGGADVRAMNARNGVGSSKIRKARSK